MCQTMTAHTSCPIGPIVGVTITTPDLQASERAYVDDLGYRVVRRGIVTDEQSRTWNRSRAAGHRFAVLNPSVGDDFSFRFIEAPIHSGYRAFSSYGWNAAELMVANVDRLAGQLAGSRNFQIIGPPQDLSFSDAIRAMQIRGPAGEILYLTQFKKPVAGLDVPPPRCDVDRVFIVIVGGPSLDDLLAFYGRQFQIPEPARMQSRVKAMSEMFGLPPEERYSIAALPLAGRSYIEADQMPPATAAPTCDAADLPPGISMVSVALAETSRHAAGCLTGAAGEILELVPA